MKLRNVVAIIGCALITAAQASVVVTTNESAPGSNIAVSYVPTGAVGNSTAYYRDSAPLSGSAQGNLYRDLGQAFSVSGSSFDMTAITWRLSAVNAGILDKSFTIDIYELSALNVAPVTGPISSQAGILTGLDPITSVGDYISFSLDQSVRMDSGKIYLVMFSFSEPTSTDTAANAIGFERTELPAGFGRLWVYNYNSETSTGAFGADNKATTFYVQAAPIPEPSTYALLGLSVLALVILRKRRHA